MTKWAGNAMFVEGGLQNLLQDKAMFYYWYLNQVGGTKASDFFFRR